VRALVVQCHEQQEKNGDEGNADVVKGLAEALCTLLVSFGEREHHHQSSDVCCFAVPCPPPLTSLDPSTINSSTKAAAVGSKHKFQQSPQRMVTRELGLLARSTIPRHRSPWHVEKKNEDETKEEVIETDSAAGDALRPLALALEAFFSVARQSSQSGSYAPAVTCVYELMKACPSDLLENGILANSSSDGNNLVPKSSIEARSELLDIVVKHLTGSSSGSSSIKFATPAQIKCTQPLLCSVSLDQWANEVLAPIAKKLRANPDAALEMVASVLAVLANYATVNQHHISQELSCFFPMEDQLKEGALLLPSAVRQLLSTTSSNSFQASTILASLVAMSPSDKTAETVATALVESLKGSPGPTTASTPEQRHVVYQVLSDVAFVIHGVLSSQEASSTTSSLFSYDVGKLSSLVLSSLSTALGKEAAGQSNSKESGCQAMAAWMALCWRLDSNKETKAGTSAAMTFFQSSITGTALTAAKEFRLRVGTVLLSDAWSFVASSSEDDPNAMSKKFASSLLNDGKESKDKVLKSLAGIVETTCKKHASGSSAISSPLDGLLAVHLLLSATASSPKDMPAAVLKLVKTYSGASSFLYAPTLTDYPSADPVSQLLPLVIEQICLFNLVQVKDVFFGGTKKTPNDVSRTLAACLLHPWSVAMRCNAIHVLKRTLENSDDKAVAVKIGAKILGHLMELANDRSLNMAKDAKQYQAIKKDFYDPNPQDDASKVLYEHDFNAKGVRDAAAIVISYLLSAPPPPEEVQGMPDLARALMLTHLGCTSNMLKSQRIGLVTHSSNMLQKAFGSSEMNKATLDPSKVAESFVGVIGPRACGPCSSEDGGESETSSVLHDAAVTFVSTLGQMAAQHVDFDGFGEDEDEEGDVMTHFLKELVTKQLPGYIASRFLESTVAVAKLTQNDLDLYGSPDGVLFKESGEDGATAGNGSSDGASAQAKKPATKKRMGKGGVSLLEEEEWERQIKEEQAEKKIKLAGGPVTKPLNAVEKVLLEKQTRRRIQIAAILDIDTPRSFASLNTLCNAGIMVGNSCLPFFSHGVLCFALVDFPAKKRFPVMQDKGVETLCTLAGCVYEIDEDFSNDIAQSLLKGLTPTKAEDIAEIFKALQPRPVKAFPPTLSEAAAIIQEIDFFGDTLCANSFWFVLPILRSALTGPRTVAGCEAALEVLNRHIPLIHDEASKALIAPLRKDIAESVLDLLSHDRSQTFFDPSPHDVLTALYTAEDTEKSKPPSSSELNPLLGEFGALGSRNCRRSSMLALGSVVSQYPSVVKGNPLVENRLWINCFDKDGDVKEAARTAWRAATSSTGNDDSLPPPSKLYALPLLALLSHKNASIRSSAAEAFASAMGMLPDTAEKGILRLCTTYIDAFPEEAAPEKATSMADPKKSATQSKPVVVKKIVKKVSKPSSATSSAIAGIGAGKKVVRKVATKKSTVGIPAPMAPPVMSKAQLESQFFGGSKSKDVEKDSEWKIDVRLGILTAIASIAKDSANIDMDLESLKLLSTFLMSFAIADSNEQVCSVARNGARDVIANYGASDSAISFLLPLIEGVLGNGKLDESALGSLPKEKLPKSVAASDRRKEGAVVALGSVALHLKGDAYLDKIDSTIDMLLETLKTPSEGVQSSVAASLSKLMKKGRTQERIESIVSLLMGDCLYGSTYAVRRGSAYGLSAAVKGSGIACLKKYDIVNKLEEACGEGSPNAKEGALCAIELLCERLGLLFEPYVIVLLPSLLRAFGDNSDYVRRAASSAATLIMSKLSSHGVKLVLPAILSAFGEPEWRTKQASIIMLGSMSNLAPKQLASSLPKIVPKLTEAFSDSHPKVKTSAEQSLNEISKVIRNPEISELSPILVRALTDPAHETKRALEALIETEFLHAIDAPSLALIVPVLYRGLRDRSASSKRMGALIAGNMCTMISDPRDFSPYLSIIIPGLKTALLDPIPDVRSTAAKALGALTRGLGEDAVPELRSWLIEKIQGEGVSTVERSGAAQGLTEVLIAGGTGVVETVMEEELFPLASHPKPAAREGALWMLAFLPTALGLAFAPMIESTLPIVLRGLADDSEPVRDVAMRAGRVLVRSHGKAHVDTILPSLEKGLSNDDWHIRLASLTLLGDLLSMIGGTKMAKGDADTQEDARQAEKAQAQIALALGTETRKRVLSRVYLSRNDTSSGVRSMAVQVWKTVVSVTPRTLRDILHVLVSQIVSHLASGNPSQTEVAGRCLGDVVGKLGDAVLPEIIPVLRDNLYRGGKHTRQGACVGLAEVISCSSKEHITKYLSILVKAVQDALCDEDEGVRSMAAGCFQSLYNTVGSRTMDEVVPALLVAMRDDADEHSKNRALQGLTGILSVRSRELLPYLLPRLLIKPITVGHANALSTISTVTGETIYAHFTTIIPTLVSELAAFEKNNEDEEEKEREDAIRASARSICGNVDTSGVNMLVSEIAKRCGNEKAPIRRESCWMLGVVAEESKLYQM
jgi:HEAT repeat protein